MLKDLEVRKTCVKPPLSNTTNWFSRQLLLNAGQKYVRMNAPRGAFCNTSDLHQATICHLDLGSTFVYFFRGHFMRILLYWTCVCGYEMDNYYSPAGIYINTVFNFICLPVFQSASLFPIILKCRILKLFHKILPQFQDNMLSLDPSCSPPPPPPPPCRVKVIGDPVTNVCLSLFIL